MCLFGILQVQACNAYVVKAWNERTSKNEELVRVSEQVKEVVGMRDRYIGSMMSQSECDDILAILCTG